MKSKKLKDERTLELFRVALTNAESQPEVIKALEKSGYDSEILEQGKELLSETRKVFDTCIKNRDLKMIAYNDFTAKMEALDEIFHRDRTKAKLVYRNNPAKAALLAISEQVSPLYMNRIVVIKKFYNETAADQSIQEDLARLNLTMDDINDGLAKIAEVEAAKTNHTQIRAESQDSTKLKDLSLASMGDWMKELFGLAKLGLKNNPQLLEALGKVVKS